MDCEREGVKEMKLAEQLDWKAVVMHLRQIGFGPDCVQGMKDLISYTDELLVILGDRTDIK